MNETPQLTLPAPADVNVTRHAAERYADRVKPGLDWLGARDEIQLLRHRCGSVHAAPPQWAAYLDPAQADGYMCFGEDVLFPLCYEQATARWVATTCLVRGHIPDWDREQRSKRKAAARRRKHVRKRREGRPVTFDAPAFDGALD